VIVSRDDAIVMMPGREPELLDAAPSERLPMNVVRTEQPPSRAIVTAHNRPFLDRS